jgi:predicted AAA+ superfamily ATPase
MWFKRIISEKIQASAKMFPAVVVTGARQTGKTSLLRRLFPEHHYVSLDIPSRAAQAEESPELFLKSHPPPLLVDEVQYAPKLFRHLKIAIDEKRTQRGQFVLTGSQKFTLMKEVSDSLAGRSALFDLETLSIEEVLGTSKKSINIEFLKHAIVRGGFPELWQDPDIDHVKFYESYLATYLERDVRQLINVVNLRDFERFIRACAARSGQLLDKSSLARDVGISPSTCNEWISVLQASNQLSLLEPWFGNFSKRLVKSPKIYLCDTGLLCFLLNLTEASLAESPFVGAIWETLIYAEIRKICATAGNPHTIWTYRDSQQSEIDFLIQTAGQTRAIECKWSEIPNESDTAAIADLINYTSKKPSKALGKIMGYVVCRTPDVHPFSNGMRGLPLDKLRDSLEIL